MYLTKDRRILVPKASIDFDGLQSMLHSQVHHSLGQQLEFAVQHHYHGLQLFKGKQGLSSSVHPAPNGRGLGEIVTHGADGCGGGKCGACEGNCNSDSDCAPGLYCFQRGGNEPLIGCTGTAGTTGWNYCLPRIGEIVTHTGCYGSGTCGVCEGDCNSDSDCAPGLYCFDRDGDEPIIGCAGTASTGWDYCLPRIGEIVTHTDCYGSGTCGVCEGDCNSDSDCAPGLYCLQRYGASLIPGCAGAGPAAGWDYCMPLARTPIVWVAPATSDTTPTITQHVAVEAGMVYEVAVEILRNDLGDASEKVAWIKIDDQEITGGEGCKPDGGDYDCTFFACPEPKVPRHTATSSSMKIELNLVGHSHDCDCDLTQLQRPDECQCTDQAGWRDIYGSDCSIYEAHRRCEDGQVTSHGLHAGDGPNRVADLIEWGGANTACCVCGGGQTPPAAQTPVSQTIPAGCETGYAGSGPIECSKENTIAGRTAVWAVARITLTPVGSLPPPPPPAPPKESFPMVGNCAEGAAYASSAWTLALPSAGKGFENGQRPEEVGVKYYHWVSKAWFLCMKEHEDTQFVSVSNEAGYQCYANAWCTSKPDNEVEASTMTFDASTRPPTASGWHNLMELFPVTQLMLNIEVNMSSTISMKFESDELVVSTDLFKPLLPAIREVLAGSAAIGIPGTFGTHQMFPIGHAPSTRDAPADPASVRPFLPMRRVPVSQG